jgi:translocation and assembly module TamB
MQVSADIARRGPLVEVRALRAFAGGGELRGEGRLDTEKMSVEAAAQLARFDPARFGEFPAGALSGKVSANGALGGAVDARWDVSGRLHDEAFATRGSARLSKERIARASAELRFGNKHLAVRGDFGRPADRLQWDFEGRQLRANGTLSGSLARHSLEAALKGPQIDARTTLAGSWRAGTWSGEVRSLRNAGRYPLQLKAPARLAVARGKVDLGPAEAALGVGYLRIAQLGWTPQRLASSGEFERLPAQWLVAVSGLSESIRSTLLLDGEWSLESRGTAAPRLTGTASLRRAGGDLTVTNGASLALGLEKAVLDARFTDGRVAIEGDIGARFAAAKVTGEITPAPGAPGLGIAAGSPVSVQAQVAFVELAALTRGLLTDARLDGRLGGDVRVAGTLGAPQLGGTLRGEALAFDVPPYGVYLKNGALRARLEGEDVVVEQFSINGGEGRFVADGRLSLRGGSAKLAWKADRLSLLERPDLRLIGTGSGTAALGEGKLSVAGELRADRGFLDLEQDRLPKLGEDVVVAGQPRAPAKARARLPLSLDLALDLGERLEVRGHGLEGRLAGRIELQTTRDGELRAYGRVQTVNATFFAYGQRLQVDPGIAVFDGPLDNPSLQMTAWRRNQAVEAGVQVSGTARNPRVQLVSQPPVPEGERLSWLVLGRPPADATKADLGMLQAAAGALLSRGTETPLDRRIAQAFGLDEITVRGTGEVAQQVVALGKRLSERLYVSFEQGIGAAASALVKLDFSLTQRLSLRAETGTSSGLGLFYRFSWD